MKLSVQQAMRRSCEAGNTAELTDADTQACSCVIKQQSFRPVGFWREYDEANKYVENGSIIPRSGTVKITREGDLLKVKISGSN